MVDSRSYQQMSDAGATDQQQYMLHGNQDQYDDEFGNDMMGQMQQQQHMDMQQDDGYGPVNALVSGLFKQRLSILIFMLVDSRESIWIQQGD